MGGVMAKLGKWKTCPDCGARFRQKVYPSGGTDSYCRPCRNERSYRSGRERVVPYRCETCDGHFMGRRQSKNPSQAGSRFCSPDCQAVYSSLYSSKYPVNPNGPHLCRAPVPGGCQRERKTHSSLCYAHQKRVERGTRIDTPVRTV